MSADRTISVQVPSTAGFEVWGLRCFAAILAACMAMCVSLLLARRLMGALAAPLPVWALLQTAAISLLATTALRGLARLALPANRAVQWGPSLLLLLLAITLWLPGTRTAGVALLIGLVLADIALATALERWSARTALQTIARTVRPTPRLSQGLPAGWSQQFTRHKVAGAEMIEGDVRTVFLAGQRITNCHLAFCPPLATSPNISCRQTEGPPVRFKVAQALPHGTRIELRLEEVPAESREVVLHVLVQDATAHQPRTQT